MEPVSAAAAAAAAAGIKLVLPPLIDMLASKLGGDVTIDEMEYLQVVVSYRIEELIGKLKPDSASSKKLLEKLQVAALELVDLFDIYEYDQLEKHVRSSFNPLKKFKFKFKEMLGPILPKSSSRDRLEKLLKFLTLVEKIEQLIIFRADTTQPQADTITPTSSTLSAPYFGRVNQRNSIIAFLLDDSHANKDLIAVTGIEGSGKTHTAQFICNDNTIKNHFYAIMWVHVARDFNVERITREMLESATNNICCNFENFDTLQKKLKESLSSELHKFLFVLDDVCCEDKMNWDLLVGPLNEATRNGSKIFITTRTESIARALGAEIVELGKLDDPDCWSIIKYYASDSHTEDEWLSYVRYGLISKLKEYPQALISVARSSRDNGSAAMDHLLKCYHSLPWHLQQCFAYCSLFPRGYKFYIDFNKQEPHLISLWIANGYIESTEELTLEEVGKNYVKELVSQSFFEQESADYFVIPDLLHDLAESVSMNLCHRVQGYGLLNIPDRCIHLSFCTTANFDNQSLFDLKAEISKLTNLRSLIILGGPTLKIIFRNGQTVLPNLTNLRALYVCPDPLMGVLSIHNIDQFKILRYLHVRNGEKLPKHLAKLYLLKTFILITTRVNSLRYDRKYLEPDTLPIGFDNLIELRTLKFYAEDGNELDYLYYNSKWINVGKLKSLQNLMAFHPEKDGYKGMMALSKLSLCGLLSVSSLENVQSKVEAGKAALNLKKSLNELIFEWSITSNDNSNICKEVLDGLKPHENLKKLEIVGYKGIAFPDWMNRLPRLQTLTLRSCTSFVISPLLPPCQQCLKVSDHNGLMRLSFVGDTGHNLVLYDHPKLSLPSIFKMSCGLCMLTVKGCSINDIDLSFLINLKYLYLVRLPSLQIIINLSPTVMDLTIEDCPKLRSVGNLQHCTSLERLKIRKCPLLLGEGPSLVEGVVEGDTANRLPQAKHTETDEPLLVLELVQQQGLSSIQGLTLFGSNRLFPPQLVEYFHQLSSLRRLVLIDFKTLPNLEKLSSLEKLNISDCPDVEELPILPDSLESITLRKCPRLTLNYGRNGELCHTISHIPDIRVY